MPVILKVIKGSLFFILFSAPILVFHNPAFNETGWIQGCIYLPLSNTWCWEKKKSWKMTGQRKKWKFTHFLTLFHKFQCFCSNRSDKYMFFIFFLWTTRSFSLFFGSLPPLPKLVFSSLYFLIIIPCFLPTKKQKQNRF